MMKGVWAQLDTVVTQVVIVNQVMKEDLLREGKRSHQIRMIATVTQTPRVMIKWIVHLVRAGTNGIYPPK